MFQFGLDKEDPVAVHRFRVQRSGLSGFIEPNFQGNFIFAHSEMTRHRRGPLVNYQPVNTERDDLNLPAMGVFFRCMQVKTGSCP